MPSIVRPVVLLVVALALVAGGCGGGTKKPGKSKQAAAKKPLALAQVDANASVTVDDDRITVSPPVGWRPQPRSRDCLARYLPGGGKTHPVVTVIGGDPPRDITAVDAANHAQFCTAVTAMLAEQFTDAEGKSTLLKKPTAVDLGPHPAVIWTAPGTAKVDGLSQPVERSCAAVVVAGRMYTVEALAPRGQLGAAGHAAARGVAAGIAAAEPPPASGPEPGPDAVEPPADEAPPAADGAG